MTRKINNPLLIQIERHARRAENWRMVKEVVGILLILAGALLIILSAFDWLAPRLGSGTIIEDNRGPELKWFYNAATMP